MMVEMFFWKGNNLLQQFENYSNLLLLSGPPSSGKTSLLFQFAFNIAAHDSNSTNPNVLFICNRHRLDFKPPFLSQGIDPSSNVFHRIRIKYVNDEEDIRNYFAAFHLHDKLPDAVVIDDFGDLFDNSQKGSCKLLLSDTHTHQGDSPRFHFIYKKWIPTTFTIKEGDISGSFILKGRSYSRTDNTATGSMKAAKYSIALQYLVFDGLVNNDQIE
ncbi:uncharacterized protein [Cicer arietinum]|uniref:Uncharacterized protein LOC101510403 isoform X2 n=1 Tax=Cicer arietinum TaxID=3827 RepID=A0A3Q7Y1G0_CICAR|nr:uncharacterized protein LOC101510403 isoform X2 [Cicer arietinum]